MSKNMVTKNRKKLRTNVGDIVFPPKILLICESFIHCKGCRKGMKEIELIHQKSGFVDIPTLKAYTNGKICDTLDTYSQHVCHT